MPHLVHKGANALQALRSNLEYLSRLYLYTALSPPLVIFQVCAHHLIYKNATLDDGS